MHFIGITGGVGAGKSRILRYLEEHYNCRILLADEIAHDLMEPGTDCYEELKTLLAGQDVYLPGGGFDRLKLARLLFEREDYRLKLNAIVHPAVHRFIEETAAAEREAGQLDALILEAALLVEENYGRICDELWYIFTSEENRRVRLKDSRNYSDEKINAIFAAQLTEPEYRQHCERAIDNNGTPEESFAQIDRMMADLGIPKKDVDSVTAE